METFIQKETGATLKIIKAMAPCSKKTPQDFVIATGEQYTVKNFIELVAKKLDMKIKWKGQGLKEKGYYKDKEIIKLIKNIFVQQVENPGDYTKAKRCLNGNQLHHQYTD